MLLVVHTISICQIIEKYKENLPLEIYNKNLNFEAELSGKVDLNTGLMYLKMGRDIGIHSELLSIEYEKLAKSIFQNLSEDSLVMSTNLSLAYPFINNGRYEEAEVVIIEVMKYTEQHGMHRMHNASHLRYGYLKYASGDYATALSYNLGCYKYLNTHFDQKHLGDITNRLGLNYIAIGDYQTALKYYITFTQLVDSLNFENTYEASMKDNMSLCYIELGEYAKAKDLLQSAISLKRKSNSSKFLAKVYFNLAKLLTLEEFYSDALIQIDSSIYYGNLFQNEKLLSEILLKKADILTKLESKPSSILEFLMKAKNMARNSNDPRLELKANERLYDFYLKKGNLSLALQYDKVADSLRSKLYSNDVIASVKNLEKSIEKENSDEKISLLQQSNDLKSEILLSEKRIKHFMIAFGILLLSVLMLLLYIIYQKTKNTKLLNEKNESIQQALNTNKILVKEIHHRVKNNLQVVSSLLNLQSRFENDNNVLQAINTGKFRVQSMSLLHQNLYLNENLHSIYIKKYFEDLVTSIVKGYPLDGKSVETHIHIENIQLDLDTVVPLGLVSNELITNVMKYAFEKTDACELQFSITEEDDIITLIVRDNGVGIPFTIMPDKSETMGMQLVTSFAKKIKATIKIDNTFGTEFRLTFDRPLSKTKLKA